MKGEQIEDHAKHKESQRKPKNSQRHPNHPTDPKSDQDGTEVEVSWNELKETQSLRKGNQRQPEDIQETKENSHSANTNPQAP